MLWVAWKHLPQFSPLITALIFLGIFYIYLVVFFISFPLATNCALKDQFFLLFHLCNINSTLNLNNYNPIILFLFHLQDLQTGTLKEMVQMTKTIKTKPTSTNSITHQTMTRTRTTMCVVNVLSSLLDKKTTWHITSRWMIRGQCNSGTQVCRDVWRYLKMNRTTKIDCQMCGSTCCWH